MRTIFLTILFLTNLFFVNQTAEAAQCRCGTLGTTIDCTECNKNNCSPCEQIGGSQTSGSISLTDPLGFGDKATDAPQQLIGRIISAVLGIVGSLALAMFIYGGFTWMLSSGNAEGVTKGKNIIIWSALGLVLIFIAYALVKFVLTGLIGA